MEEIDYKALIKLVEENTRPSSRVYVDDNDKPLPNLANLGAKIGDIARMDRRGEYTDLTVEILEPARRLLTDAFVIQLLKILDNEDYVSPLEMLSFISLDMLWYVLDKWLTKSVEGYNKQIPVSKKYPQLDKWIETVTHDPLLMRIKVIGIGHNVTTDDSVVPEDWIDREFANGYEMQAEMGRLPSRVGKPPVTYAIIYGMIIDKKNTICQKIPTTFKYLFYVDKVSRNVVSELTDTVREGYQYVKYDDTVIGFKLTDLLEPKGSTGKKDVGIMVSRLQKAIRRGRYGAAVLLDTMEALNNCPNYNLPEHSFMRVSASKQLAWRLYITILEDVRPYDNPELISLQTLMLLAMICNIVLEYRFTGPVLKSLIKLALTAQYNDDTYARWDLLPAIMRPQISLNTFKNSITLAINNMTMMSGDRSMLLRYYNYKDIKPFVVPNFSQLESRQTVGNQIILASYDQHNRTYIILYYQACLELGLTTKAISGRIWDISSSYNVRYHEKQITDPLLISIQEYLHTGRPDVKKFQDVLIPDLDIVPLTESIKRQSFLILFGSKYRYKGKDAILAGTVDKPVRLKIKDEWINTDEMDAINAFPKRTIKLDMPPPIGFKWRDSMVTVGISKGKPTVNSRPIPFFDGSSMLEPNLPYVARVVSDELFVKVAAILNADPLSFEDLLELRNGAIDSYVHWVPDVIDYTLIKIVYTKLQNAMNNIVGVGPVTRAGTKMQNAINYVYEGKSWAVFNLFCYLYPDAIRPHGATNFQINPNSYGYSHLVQSIKDMLFQKRSIAYPSIPVIKTQLWDHQQSSVAKITYGYSQGQYGYGDASAVGAGKTLTALAIASHLIAIKDDMYSGVLVLLPNDHLIETWAKEINTHTEGFHIIYQRNCVIDEPIRGNTLVISTMSKQRDYPTDHSWLLLIIDECLTVQNKNAQWTESAWKQSAMSKHLLMMSATFFRTRFDKLYYMLKMLRTGLPEAKQYLDTILSESIVSQISTITLPWISTFHYLQLDKQTRAEYDLISQENLSTETMYAKLTSILVDSAKASKKLIKQLLQIIALAEARNSRCLLYARSDTEASFWSEQMKIPIYPNKGKHCIVTLSKGTYGLNDLVIYDTIIMRPPAPDKLPQIKGRLDRPGQQALKLYIEYFIFKDTIEMGLILRLNIASQFVQKYIMPLATFYDISVNYASLMTH